MVVATDGPEVVGRAGPVSVLRGRGGFHGVVVGAQYRRRKIGTVLFSLMCAELRKLGATHTVLYTGLSGFAQEIYLRAGCRITRVVDFSLVKQLS